MLREIYESAKSGISRLAQSMEEKYMERLRKLPAEELCARIDEYDASWKGILTDCFLPCWLKGSLDPLHVTAGVNELRRKHREGNRFLN